MNWSVVLNSLSTFAKLSEYPFLGLLTFLTRNVVPNLFSLCGSYFHSYPSIMTVGHPQVVTMEHPSDLSPSPQESSVTCPFVSSEFDISLWKEKVGFFCLYNLRYQSATTVANFEIHKELKGVTVLL